MRKIMKFSIKELRFIYLIELIVYLGVFAVTSIGNWMIFDKTASDLIKLILIINVCIHFVSIGNVLINREGKLILSSGISGRKFLCAKIIEFILVQMSFTLVGYVFILLKAQIKTGFNGVFFDYSNLFALFIYSVIIYMLIAFVIVFLRSKTNKRGVIIILGVGITFLLFFILLLSNNYIATVRPIGTFVFDAQSLVTWSANLLNAGQSVFGLEIHINIFSIIVKLGLLLGAFFYVAKIIDKKLDIA
ncbi:hypothetical protein [Clostridium intestinale]|uniref:Uncharacterized protein n=1 Tax=Clostridium intestinale TaxID=36845 RepID=A0A7D7A374_9CLOT|nr:hypothetical protein [Clostridium intestinale]QLY79778.1 hypothetical protein HZF06_22615 [Clostridium intestinale]